MKKQSEKIDVGKLGEQFGIIYRKLRPRVEEAIAKPGMQSLSENREKSFHYEFGDSLSQKDMLDLLTFYLVMDPVYETIYDTGDSVD